MSLSVAALLLKRLLDKLPIPDEQILEAVCILVATFMAWLLTFALLHTSTFATMKFIPRSSIGVGPVQLQCSPRGSARQSQALHRRHKFTLLIYT